MCYDQKDVQQIRFMTEKEVKEEEKRIKTPEVVIPKPKPLHIPGITVPTSNNSTEQASDQAVLSQNSIEKAVPSPPLSSPSSTRPITPPPPSMVPVQQVSCFFSSS